MSGDESILKSKPINCYFWCCGCEYNNGYVES